MIRHRFAQEPDGYTHPGENRHFPDRQRRRFVRDEGVEVETVDPNSPAAQAGLQAKTGMTPIGAAGTTASGMLGPLNMLVMPLLEKSFGSWKASGAAATEKLAAVDEPAARQIYLIDKPGAAQSLRVEAADGTEVFTINVVTAPAEPIVRITSFRLLFLVLLGLVGFMLWQKRRG